MRVALCIHRDNLDKAFETYHHISNKDFVVLHQHYSMLEQVANNIMTLLAMKEDLVMGIYDTLKDCALISK